MCLSILGHVCLKEWSDSKEEDYKSDIGRIEQRLDSIKDEYIYRQKNIYVNSNVNIREKKNIEAEKLRIENEKIFMELKNKYKNTFVAFAIAFVGLALGQFSSIIEWIVNYLNKYLKEKTVVDFKLIGVIKFCGRIVMIINGVTVYFLAMDVRSITSNYYTLVSEISDLIMYADFMLYQ